MGPLARASGNLTEIGRMLGGWMASMGPLARASGNVIRPVDIRPAQPQASMGPLARASGNLMEPAYDEVAEYRFNGAAGSRQRKHSKR